MRLSWGPFHTGSSAGRGPAGPPMAFAQRPGPAGRAAAQASAGRQGRSCLVLPGKALSAPLLPVSPRQTPVHPVLPECRSRSAGAASRRVPGARAKRVGFVLWKGTGHNPLPLFPAAAEEGPGNERLARQRRGLVCNSFNLKTVKGALCI